MFVTPRGTPYAVLRGLAHHGHAPSRHECEACERQGRIEHALGFRELARLTLLCARALWSAHRARFTS